MDCKRAQGLITAFINGQLNDDDVMKAFLEHVDSCAECREELEVTYSLLTAMKQLDEDTDLSDNYIAELNHKIETCYIDGLKKKRSVARRWALVVALIISLLFLNGITVTEERQETERRFLREVVGIELPEKFWEFAEEDVPCAEQPEKAAYTGDVTEVGTEEKE